MRHFVRRNGIPDNLLPGRISKLHMPPHLARMPDIGDESADCKPRSASLDQKHACRSRRYSQRLPVRLLSAAYFMNSLIL